MTETTTAPLIQQTGLIFSSNNRAGSEKLVVAALNGPPGIPFSVRVATGVKATDDVLLKDARSIVEYISPFHIVREAYVPGAAAEFGTILCEAEASGGFTLHGLTLPPGHAARLVNKDNPVMRSGSGRIPVPDWDARLAATNDASIGWDAHTFVVAEADLSFDDLLQLLMTTENDRYEFKSHAGAVAADDVVDFATGATDGSQKLLALLNTIDQSAPHAALVIGATVKGVPLGLALDDGGTRKQIVRGIEHYFRDVFPLVPRHAVSVSFVDVQVAFKDDDVIAVVPLPAPDDGDIRRQAIEVVGRGLDPSDDRLAGKDEALPTEVLLGPGTNYLVWVLKTGAGFQPAEGEPTSDGVDQWHRARSVTGGVRSHFAKKARVHWRVLPDGEDGDSAVDELAAHANVYKVELTAGSGAWVAVRRADPGDSNARFFGELLHTDGYVRPDRTVVVIRLTVPLGVSHQWTQGIFADRLATWQPRVGAAGDWTALPMDPFQFYLRQRDAPLVAGAVEALTMPDSIFSILVDVGRRFPALLSSTTATFELAVGGDNTAELHTLDMANKYEDEAARLWGEAQHLGMDSRCRPLVVCVFPLEDEPDDMMSALLALAEYFRNGADVVGVAWPGCQPPARVFEHRILPTNWRMVDVCDGERAVAHLSLMTTQAALAMPSPLAAADLGDTVLGFASHEDDILSYLHGSIGREVARRTLVDNPSGVPVERTSVGLAADLITAIRRRDDNHVHLLRYWRSAPRAGVTTFLVLLEAALQAKTSVAACVVPRRSFNENVGYNIWREVAARGHCNATSDSGPVVVVLILDCYIWPAEEARLQDLWADFQASDEGAIIWPEAVAVVVSSTTSYHGRDITIPAFFTFFGDINLYEAAFLDVARVWDAYDPPIGRTSRADAIQAVADRARAAVAQTGISRWDAHIWNFPLALVYATGSYADFVLSELNKLPPDMTSPGRLSANEDLWTPRDVLVALSTHDLLAPLATARTFVDTRLFCSAVMDTVARSALVEVDRRGSHERARIVHVAFAAEILRLLESPVETAIATAVAASGGRRLAQRALLKGIVAVRGPGTSRFSPLVSGLIDAERSTATGLATGYDPRGSATKIEASLAPAFNLLHPDDADVVRAHLLVAQARVLCDGRRFDAAVAKAEAAIALAKELHAKWPEFARENVSLELFHSAYSFVCNERDRGNGDDFIGDNSDDDGGNSHGDDVFGAGLLQRAFNGL